MNIRVGCAGWTIPKLSADRFPTDGSQLERYAKRFPVVEINSSFYRAHQAKTYARWAASVPESFQFAVKMPREITHVHRLAEVGSLDRFLAETSALGAKLGPWLVQLPPSLEFDAVAVSRFLAALRERFVGSVACEPRHVSWFTSEADRLLVEFRVARVAADPASDPLAAEPGGWVGLIYYRLHGSPRMYYAAYSPDFLDALARRLIDATARSVAVWCIFDNTALGAATANALDLLDRLEQ